MVALPVEIIVRGGWRSLRKNCNFPPLFIRFPQAQSTGTPFEGQLIVPLTTHCHSGSPSIEDHFSRSHRNYEQYLLKEYLGYRLYNLITDTSLRVRLTRINYIQPEDSRKSVTKYAFFSEHFESAAERSKTKLLPRRVFDHKLLDTRSVDLLAQYHFMIGSTDWSILEQHNTRLLELPTGTYVPLPYDLDFSGLVNAHYASPRPDLPIQRVRTRYFLGFCRPDGDWTSSFNEIQALRPEFLALIDEVPGLFKATRKSVKNYIGQYFEILDSKKKRTKWIIKKCQPWPPAPVDKTGRD